MPAFDDFLEIFDLDLEIFAPDAFAPDILDFFENFSFDFETVVLELLDFEGFTGSPVEFIRCENSED